MKTTWKLLDLKNKKSQAFLFSMFAAAMMVATLKAQAFERYEFYNGVRQMGMGGVVVATVNDETALISNPAALGKLRNSFLTLLDPELAGSNNVPGIIKKGGAATSFTDPQLLLNQLNSTPDKHLNASAHVFPSFVTTNFGFGVHGSYRYNAEVDSEENLFRYNYQNDLALIMGLSLRLFDGRVKIGFSGRVINRVEADYFSDETALDPSRTDIKLKDLTTEGVGVGGDVGLILTGPWTFLPSIGAVLRDAGGTSYNLNDGFLTKSETRPPITQQTIDAGLSVSPILGRQMRLQIGVDYTDVQNKAKDPDAMKRVHGGLELNYADMIMLRAGWNQRYWTGGLEFNMMLFQFQAASFGEEIGTAANPREDRRYMGKISLRF